MLCKRSPDATQSAWHTSLSVWIHTFGTMVLHNASMHLDAQQYIPMHMNHLFQHTGSCSDWHRPIALLHNMLRTSSRTARMAARPAGALDTAIVSLHRALSGAQTTSGQELGLSTMPSGPLLPHALIDRAGHLESQSAHGCMVAQLAASAHCSKHRCRCLSATGACTCSMTQHNFHILG